MATASQFLTALAAKIGVHEDPAGSNCQEFSHYLGRPCEPWCADFLAATAERIGLDLPGDSAYTPNLALAFQDADRWGETPKIGALVFFAFGDRIDHVAAVELINPDGSLGTIEGNTDEAGGRTGGRVMRHTRTRHIEGYGYPNYTPEDNALEADMTHEQNVMLTEIRKIVGVTDDRVNKLTAALAAVKAELDQVKQEVQK